MQQIPVIRPLSSDIQRPLWSVMIPVYNCRYYLRTTLRSVLSQDPGADMMQIEVVDDCSTDEDVELLVKEVGHGRVLYHRQENNVGSLMNFETCLNRARGQIIHLLHGDDVVLPGYYTKMNNLFCKYPSVKVACSSYNYINGNEKVISTAKNLTDRDGVLENWLETLATKQRLQYCCVSVKREVYEDLGGFYGVHFGEDWEMWVRIATKYQYAYTSEVLASYRLHGSSISERSYLSGQNISDLTWAIDKIEAHLPVVSRQKVKKKALRNVSIKLIINGFFLWKRTRNAKVGMRQLRGAIKLYVDGYVVFISCLRMLNFIFQKAIKVIYQ